MSSWARRAEGMSESAALTSSSPAVLVSLTSAHLRLRQLRPGHRRLGVRRHPRLPRRRATPAGWRAALRRRRPTRPTSISTRRGLRSPGFRSRCCRAVAVEVAWAASCWRLAGRGGLAASAIHGPGLPWRCCWADSCTARPAGATSSRCWSPSLVYAVADARRPVGHWRGGVAEAADARSAAVHAWRRDWRSVGIGLGVAAILWLPILFFGLWSYPFGAAGPNLYDATLLLVVPGPDRQRARPAPTHSGPLGDPPPCPCRPDRRTLAISVVVAAFLAVQVLVPLVALFGPRPARFSWQMYSALPRRAARVDRRGRRQ